MFLTKEQRASQGIDNSFRPNAIADIYLGAVHSSGILALYDTPSQLNSAFLSMTQDDLTDADFTDITYTIAAEYAKHAHKVKQHPDTIKSKCA